MGFPEGVQKTGSCSLWQFFFATPSVFINCSEITKITWIQKLLDPRHLLPERPKDRSLPPPRTSTAAAPWLSHQFCRLQIQKKSSVRQIDVSTGSNGDWDVSMEFKVRKRNI
ncbi:hypothetical protein B9Z55_008432 [Caenorhabditis nigoni]|nr:hypothetical protein B9Z55_008432 [Caenorhabditis nigoni]